MLRFRNFQKEEEKKQDNEKEGQGKMSQISCQTFMKGKGSKVKQNGEKIH